LKHEAPHSVKLGTPWKEKCLCLTIILRSFESKVINIATTVGDPFESKVAYLYARPALAGAGPNARPKVVLLRHRAQSTVLWPFWWGYFSKI